MWPEWWDWELVFTGHAELRMVQRSVTEVDVRAMLHRARSYSPSIVPGRFLIETTNEGQLWIVIVEPDFDERAIVIVTVYEHGR